MTTGLPGPHEERVPSAWSRRLAGVSLLLGSVGVITGVVLLLTRGDNCDAYTGVADAGTFTLLAWVVLPCGVIGGALAVWLLAYPRVVQEPPTLAPRVAWVGLVLNGVAVLGAAAGMLNDYTCSMVL